MLSNEIKEQIDSGFQILGTAPEREVLYDLMEKLLTSETGQRLYDLLGTKKKILLGFYHKERKGENIPYDGGGFHFNPFFNKIFINMEKRRSEADRISTLTHELFHALQYKTKTLHRGFTPKEGRQVFLLNEVEARFKCMEILHELYPNANYAQMDISYETKIDCLVYKALLEQAQKSLKTAGQKSPEISKKIAKRVARAEMIKSQLFSITPHVAQVLGANWSNEFESINQAWQESYYAFSKYNSDLTPLIPLLPMQTKPTLSEIQTMIANRLELPVSVFQKERKSMPKKVQNIGALRSVLRKNLTK